MYILSMKLFFLQLMIHVVNCFAVLMNIRYPCPNMTLLSVLTAMAAYCVQCGRLAADGEKRMATENLLDRSLPV